MEVDLTVLLGRLVDDYSTRKQPSLIQMKKGLISRESFLGRSHSTRSSPMESPGNRQGN